ncbi:MULTISPECIES: hypothetical protein [Legionella]|uniref:Uncharacterized protein n=1 Tax=Legionella drozanskii LLAP-1 TaxID=1212489 RepID=A0A0W0SWI2_9GAMM|nr:MULTISPECIES: hypothetical protein [Legionella]KTC87730.1 hypothetical protein Ldro_1349 [Legionella drozanskii LLAP-1]PJE05839.1 MAG: hypothetical protein CK430_15250 [Legionella sp.]
MYSGHETTLRQIGGVYANSVLELFEKILQEMIEKFPNDLTLAFANAKANVIANFEKDNILKGINDQLQAANEQGLLNEEYRKFQDFLELIGFNPQNKEDKKILDFLSEMNTNVSSPESALISRRSTMDRILTDGLNALLHPDFIMADGEKSSYHLKKTIPTDNSKNLAVKLLVSCKGQTSVAPEKTVNLSQFHEDLNWTSTWIEIANQLINDVNYVETTEKFCKQYLDTEHYQIHKELLILLRDYIAAYFLSQATELNKLTLSLLSHPLSTELDMMDLFNHLTEALEKTNHQSFFIASQPDVILSSSPKRDENNYSYSATVPFFSGDKSGKKRTSEKVDTKSEDNKEIQTGRPSKRARNSLTFLHNPENGSPSQESHQEHHNEEQLSDNSSSSTPH